MSPALPAIALQPPPKDGGQREGGGAEGSHSPHSQGATQADGRPHARPGLEASSRLRAPLPSPSFTRPLCLPGQRGKLGETRSLECFGAGAQESYRKCQKTFGPTDAVKPLGVIAFLRCTGLCCPSAAGSFHSTQGLRSVAILQPERGLLGEGTRTPPV